MRYCINYGNKKFKYFDKIDEITINFTPRDSSIINFLLESKGKRININIKDKEDFINNKRLKLFDVVKSQCQEIDFAFRLTDFKAETTKTVMELIKSSENKHKFFFDTTIGDWDTLNGYVGLGVSDIYVVEDLGFEIKKVAELLHSHGIRIRVYPNVAQSKWRNTNPFRKFFIRPEDVHLYEDYIDAMEFYGRDDFIQTYYKIYAIDKKWFGKLKEIIIDFDSEIDNRCILSKFGPKRIECGKKCAKGKPCNVCSAIVELAEVLEKNKLIISDFEK